MDANQGALLLFTAAVIGFMAAASLISRILDNPFRYPYFNRTFDVSRKRNVHINDYIDEFLSSEAGIAAIQRHEQKVAQWKADCDEKVEHSILREYRRRQLNEVMDDEHRYRFHTSRMRIKYRQRNYVKTAYTEPVRDETSECSIEWLRNRYRALGAIGFETTLRKYGHKEQRTLMTAKLKQQIKERDHYTCQMCGKYMPDEVGLQIDHIVPVSRGGKSVPSNLRVLCDKCNRKKGAKVEARYGA